MKKTNLIQMLLLGLAWTLSNQALAGGDPVTGEKLAATCKGCHSVVGYFNVYPSYHVPKLGGQHAPYLAAALKAYRAGDRSHPTMRANAANLSDQDIEDIAAYFSSNTGVH